jgi:hypothetical protein
VPSRRTIVSTVLGRASRRVDAGGAHGPTAERPVSWSAGQQVVVFERRATAPPAQPGPQRFQHTAAFAAVTVAAPTNPSASSVPTAGCTNGPTFARSCRRMSARLTIRGGSLTGR